MDEEYRERLAAVERAITAEESDDPGELATVPAAETLDELEADIETLRDEVDELTAETQALRGYVGNIESVNEDVRDRANRALDRVDAVADRVDAVERPEAGPTERGEPHHTRDRHRAHAPATCPSCGRPEADSGGRQPQSAADGGRDPKPEVGSTPNARGTEVGRTDQALGYPDVDPPGEDGVALDPGDAQLDRSDGDSVIDRVRDLV